MKTGLCALLILFLSSVASELHAQDIMLENSDLNLSIVIDQKPAREFVAYTLDEVCKEFAGNACATHYTADERVKLTVKNAVGDLLPDIVYFEGPAREYIDFLNSKEKELTRLGVSLRDEAETLNLRRLPTDILALRRSLLETLGIFANDLLDKIRDPILGDRCTQIPPVSIDQLPKKVVELSDGKILKLPELIEKLNESQRVLCALGYDLFADTDTSELTADSDGFVDKIIAKREAMLDELGLSKYMGVFNLEDFEKAKEFVDIAKDINDLVQAKQFPGPEQIFDLRNKLNAQLPDDLQIPDVPNIPAPVAPKRLDLNLKKRKDWTGFNFGKREVIATGADAFLEVRGNKSEEALTAQGKASIYIFSREINALGGYAQLQAGPKKVSAHVELKALGQDVFDPIDEVASVQFTKDVPNAFVWNFDQAYSYQFAIGPIPVDVRVGARANIGLGYSVGIATTRINGAIYPKANAEGYAEAAAGIRNVLAVGAGAQITLLDLRVPLTGSVGFQFDEVGYPYLTLGINSDVTYEYLNGKIYAFVEYPVPALRLPPWKTKHDNFDIYTFNGEKKKHKIMNYRINVGRSGAKTSGDLLDQGDQAESKALSEAILLDQKQKALSDLESKVNAEVRDSFSGILRDLAGVENSRAANQSEEVRIFREQFDSNLKALETNAAEAAGH